jgi:hypothetical protein
MCEECRDKHLKNPKYKNHEVVLYQERVRQLPVEKCAIHPNKDIYILCEDCSAPLCSYCKTQEDHQGHKFIDLETVYADRMALCLFKISKVDKYFLPTSQDLKKEIKDDVAEIKMIMDSLRASVKADGESIKSVVDTIVSENVQHVDNIEYVLLEKLRIQNTTFDDYISYLHQLRKDFHSYLASLQVSNIIPKPSERVLEILPVPETQKPATPVFTVGQYKKDDVVKLLGKINVNDTRAETRNIIQPKEIIFPPISVELTEEQKKEDMHNKSDAKQAISLSSTVTKVRKFKVPGTDGTYHISVDKSGSLWVSDNNGTLFQTDIEGNQLQEILICGTRGCHTVTQSGELIFKNRKSHVINKITLDNKITEFMKTGDWAPISIHSSHINGDILVGMVKDGEAKVTRYNKTGKELQNIQRDSDGQGLYSVPFYITENINGDICVSDNMQAVVVVNKSGQYRFSYTDEESEFWPWGICTDVLGHILVCDGYLLNETVHLIDQDGHFLLLLLTPLHGVHCPLSVCVDDEHNLYVTQSDNTVAVYRYMYLQ